CEAGTKQCAVMSPRVPRSSDKARSINGAATAASSESVIADPMNGRMAVARENSRFRQGLFDHDRDLFGQGAGPFWGEVHIRGTLDFGESFPGEGVEIIGGDAFFIHDFRGDGVVDGV